MKYQPYRGYGGGKPWYWYGESCYPRRIKVKGDWRMASRPPHLPDQVCCDWHAQKYGQRIERCRTCGKLCCHWCGCWHPWKKWGHDSAGSTWEKNLAHRTFRRWARRAIQEEISFVDPEDADVSHAFRYCGTWLD